MEIILTSLNFANFLLSAVWLVIVLRSVSMNIRLIYTRFSLTFAIASILVIMVAIFMIVLNGGTLLWGLMYGSFRN